MSDSGKPIRTFSVTTEGMRDAGRICLEDLELQHALSRAAEAGMIAGATDFERPELSVEEVAHLGEQLQNIEARVSRMPRLDAALSPEQTERFESRRFAGSLQTAERAERGIEGVAEPAAG